MTIRPFLVDDHALVRTCIRMILSGAVDIDIIGVDESGEQALTHIRGLQPGVVVFVGGCRVIPTRCRRMVCCVVAWAACMMDRIHRGALSRDLLRYGHFWSTIMRWREHVSG